MTLISPDAASPGSADTPVPALRAACWAVAMGGTRRGYIAQGGVLDSPGDLATYMDWAAAAQQALLDRLYGLGVATVVALIRIPSDRGALYRQLAAQSLLELADSPQRQAWYRTRDLRVSAAGDLSALGAKLGLPELGPRLAKLAAITAGHTGPTLVYLLRGGWVEPAVEESTLGYQLGLRLGRPPTRSELVRAFYTYDIPPLSLYIGSGRPQFLPIPFLRGHEHSYWSQTPLMHLDQADWQRLITDHLEARQTQSGRAYPADDATRARLQALLISRPATIVGVGQKHPEFGFWMPL